MTNEKKKPVFKKIAASGAGKKLMADHFYELDAASKSGSPKVAWCTSVGPAELLRAMGFLVYFPENHGAMLGATRAAMDYIPLANAEGYSPDICSYLTSDVGSYIKGETPLSRAYKGIDGVPGPDVLVYNTNQCHDVKDWFMWYSRKLNVPCIGVESPHNVDETTNVHMNAVSKQIQNLVPILEEISGQKLDLDRLKEVVGLSRRCSDLWEEVLKTAAARPSPLTFFDSTILMGPAVVARGTQEAVDFYELLLPELKQRIEDGVAAVEGEEYRIFWDGMPIWGKLRDLSNLFTELKTCVVASTYCNSWIFTALEAGDPFDSMARAYTDLFIVRSEQAKQQIIEEMVKLYSVDGLLFHDSKTCPNNSNNRYGMPERLVKELEIPSVTISGDLNDLRLYSEEQSITKIEALIEGIAQK
ncbi:2-hydroxyacyl-CoA dehydratase subunit D [candidate division CSSED10-310 bacterium]|uniref:2-hydroxyacyl-CoA dehydratase subunit D n=1 Tax=candidate division CSSED10-310 bacterium TaxID=2855610 RepID=A0ABV6Z3M9_UNCC1